MAVHANEVEGWPTIHKIKQDHVSLNQLKRKECDL